MEDWRLWTWRGGAGGVACGYIDRVAWCCWWRVVVVAVAAAVECVRLARSVAPLVW